MNINKAHSMKPETHYSLVNVYMKIINKGGNWVAKAKYCVSQ